MAHSSLRSQIESLTADQKADQRPLRDILLDARGLHAQLPEGPGVERSAIEALLRAATEQAVQAIAANPRLKAPLGILIDPRWVAKPGNVVDELEAVTRTAVEAGAGLDAVPASKWSTPFLAGAEKLLPRAARAKPSKKLSSALWRIAMHAVAAKHPAIARTAIELSKKGPTDPDEMGYLASACTRHGFAELAELATSVPEGKKGGAKKSGARKR